jgi:hypothetical protein
MFDPVPPGCCVSIDIRFTGSASQTAIYDVSSKEPLLASRRDGKVGAYGIDVALASDDRQVLAQIRANFVHSNFFARTNIDGIQTEIAAVHFKLAQKNSMARKRFSVYVPRLGVKLPAGDSSALLKHKESALKLTQRAPMMKGGVPVLYFGGRVKVSCTKNHILINDEIPGDIFVFGKATEGHYIAEIAAPLTGIQGICLSLVHLTTH